MKQMVSFLLFLSLFVRGDAMLYPLGESSYPYLSGDTWRLFCNWRLTKQETFSPLDVSLGDTICVEHGCLEDFATEYLPLILSEVILITPNIGWEGDDPKPGPFDDLLKSDKIAAWFLQNIDRKPGGKLIPIPIGLSSKQWAHGNTELYDLYIPKQKPIDARTNWIYVNFQTHTNPRERGRCLSYFQNKEGVVVAADRSIPDYLQDLGNAVFVISPFGNGIDCHRTWEALLMGCYPVVRSSTLDPLFSDLPVVIVKDWPEVTQKFLEKKFREFREKAWNRDPLYAPYWFKIVEDFQQKVRRSRSSS